jgi:hypothetical protein
VGKKYSDTSISPTLILTSDSTMKPVSKETWII